MNAAKKAFLTTRIGDVLLFMGMLFLYSQTGTLTFPEIFKPEVLSKLATATIASTPEMGWGPRGRAGAVGVVTTSI